MTTFNSKFPYSGYNLLCNLECDKLTCFKVQTTAFVEEVIFYQTLLTWFKNQIAKKRLKYRAPLP